MVRGEAIVEVHDGEPFLGEVHAVKLHDLFIAIYPAAAMDGDDDGQFALLVLGAIDVEDVPGAVIAITQIIKPFDVGRGDEAFVAFGIVNFVALAEGFD